MLQQVSTFPPVPVRSPRLAFLPILTAALLAGCGKNMASPDAPGAGPKAPVAVTLAPVRPDTVETTLKVVGTLHGEEEVRISAEVSGRIDRIFADIGDRVAPGAELARIDPVAFERAVTQARMALNEALSRIGLTKPPEGELDVEAVPTVARARLLAANMKDKLERARRLFGKPQPLVSQEEFNDAETAHAVAVSNYEVARLEARSQLAVARLRQSELESARKRLDDTRVTAPAAESVNAGPGATLAVTRRHAAGGEFVREGDPLFDLVLDDPVKLRGSVPERHLPRISRDQPVRIHVESHDQPFEGRVSRINPAINVANRSFEIEITAPNAEHRLRPGAFAVAQVVIGREEAVPFVPREAVVSFAGVDRVFTVADGKAVEHIVRTGETRGDLVAVVEGLGGVESVVTEGSRQLADGDAVTAGAGTR